MTFCHHPACKDQRHLCVSTDASIVIGLKKKQICVKAHVLTLPAVMTLRLVRTDLGLPA